MTPTITVVRGNDVYFPKGNEQGSYYEPLWLASCGDIKNVHGRTPEDARERCTALLMLKELDEKEKL